MQWPQRTSTHAVATKNLYSCSGHKEPLLMQWPQTTGCSMGTGGAQAGNVRWDGGAVATKRGAAPPAETFQQMHSSHEEWAVISGWLA